MKKKIVILGSTGSIGKTTISLIKRDKKNFEIKLLSTNKKIDTLINQAKEFKVKNLIITDHDKFLYAKNRYREFKFYNTFSIIDLIFKDKQVDYVMNSIIGLDGLEPTLQIIPKTKYIAIVNKEALICGWNLIKKKLTQFKTKFIPIDFAAFFNFFFN